MNAATKTPILYILLLVTLSSTLSLIFAEWVLRYQKRIITSSDHMDPGMIQYNAQLGWKLKHNWSGNHHHYDYDVKYTINRKGFRGQPFSANKSSYSIVGDSFSFGIGVNDDETFASLLSDNHTDNNSDIHSDMAGSSLNYSVPGYSTDQQLLLIKELYNSDKITNHIVLVLYLGNDIFDNMRTYPLQADHGKPYFKLVDNQLVLANTPVPLTAKSAAARKETISAIVLGNDSRKGKNVSWLSQLELSRRLGLFQDELFQNRSLLLADEEMQTRFAESLIILSALLEEMEKVVIKNNGTLSVVLLPGRSYVELPESLSAQYQEFFRRHIVTSHSDPGSLRIIDLARHLRDLHESGINNLYFPNEGHLTVRGHQYVADYLSTKLYENQSVSD